MDQTIGMVIGIVLIVITLLLIFWGTKKEAAQKPVEPKPAAVVSAADDLVIIEGIGPKIAALLKQNGIATFAQLATADVAVLEKILKDHGLSFAKPDSWPQQAKLAAEGKMDALKALQDQLTAGR